MSVTTTTCPFTAIRRSVQNKIDRFKGAHLIQKMNDKLIEHKQYIAEYGQDLEEIRNWEWHK